MILRRNDRTYITALIILVIIGVLHQFGIYERLYFLIPWYDIPMHFLGGSWVGFTALWAFSLRSGSFVKNFLLALIMTFCVAVAWEVFEFAMGMTYLSAVTSLGLTYWQDTIKDLIVGSLGGVVAFFIDRFYPRGASK